MGWSSKAVRKHSYFVPESLRDMSFVVPQIEPAEIDWDRLVVLDFETYYDDDYTLKKLSTSEYIRDSRFRAQCVGLKVGRKPVKVYPREKIKAALAAIPWGTHSLLAHHVQFDGLICYEHFGIRPKKLYDTLSMARALYSNDIGAGLDEVSLFTGGQGKVKDVLENTKGVLVWSKALYEATVPYVVRDVEECLRIFKHMLPAFPASEIELTDRVCRMFTEPVLKVDRPRVQKELERELAEKKAMMLSFVKDADAAGISLTNAEVKALDEDCEDSRNVKRVKKLIGSAKFVELLKAEGIDPPVKISPAYMKGDRAKRQEMEQTGKKWAYAFSKTDLEFMALLEHESPRVRALVEARLAVKSTTNETRAGRFLAASENGACLPVYLKIAAAHTHRLGGGNKMNMQNLKRGGELRRSILAPPGHVIAVQDSGQIEARVNGWFWGQDDLIDGFRIADAFERSQASLPKDKRKTATGNDRDVYCKFADTIYGREITKADDLERFVGKVGILGLGYQMGPPRLQKTLALGLMGPAVHLDDPTCARIVGAYRAKNHRIKAGWATSMKIIEDMATGKQGSYRCIAWDKETLILPNGMTMHYPNLHNKTLVKIVQHAFNPELFDGEDFDPNWPEFVYTRKEAEAKIYGGLLTENIVQALARIIVMEQLLEISKQYRVVMTTHDEVAVIAPKKQADKALEMMHKAMSTPPWWCADIPLNCEGKYDVFYAK